MKSAIPLLCLWCLSFVLPVRAEKLPPDLARLVSDTHAASLAIRNSALRKTIAKDTCWPDGIWGDNLWCLAALYLNEKTDEANARLLKHANEFITKKPEKLAPTSPEDPGKLPWTFFSVTDYVRTLCLFHSASTHFPGRLKPETEAAMKEALWLWTSSECRMADAGPDDLFHLLGTENHDLNRRPAYYLTLAVLQNDGAYRNRKLNDGHTTAEHAAAYTAYFREWPLRRAQSGLWIEVGSNTYQKYSWPSLFNLHDLSPDPLIRHRFSLLLDLAFVEESQISVHPKRGGGISRGDYGPNGFASYKNLLFAREGKPAGSSHSRVMETSRYQLPAEAILLARQPFPQPFIIRNRVLGKLATLSPDQTKEHRIDPDSALVNYAYRTPHYLLGCTLLDPRVEYSGISNQKRACGMLFEDSASDDICSVHTIIEHGPGGRPQRSFWTVQHQNMLLIQRIPPTGKIHPGSYNTLAISIGFAGKGLAKVEKDDWIFASNGKAFVGVRFLDGKYQWNPEKTTASPVHFDRATDKSRVLFVAGDIQLVDSFEKFQAVVLAHPPEISPDKVLCTSGFSNDTIGMTSFDSKSPQAFTLPLINGKPIDLHPTRSYQSPYLNGTFGSGKITMSIGPIHRTLDFLETARP